MLETRVRQPGQRINQTGTRGWTPEGGHWRMGARRRVDTGGVGTGGWTLEGSGHWREWMKESLFIETLTLSICIVKGLRVPSKDVSMSLFPDL